MFYLLHFLSCKTYITTQPFQINYFAEKFKRFECSATAYDIYFSVCKQFPEHVH